MIHSTPVATMTRGQQVIWDRRIWIGLASLSGAAGVLAGAIGAHGAADPMARRWLETGAEYQMIHALAAIVAVCVVDHPGRRAQSPPALFLLGSFLFCGTLYAMAIGAPRWLGAVTPVGGLIMLAGWGALAWAAISVDRRHR
jgi:uncharacterized membrane protein YgdD (TMEM256/DUF423 family)